MLADLTELLLACPAFRGVEHDRVQDLVPECQIARLAEASPPVTGVLVVMRGGVLVRDAQGRALEAAGTGELVVIDDDRTVDPAAPTLVVWLPERARELTWSVPPSMTAPPVTPLAGAVRGTEAGSPVDLQATSVRRVMHAPVELVPGSATCQEVARLMRDLGISSMLVDIGGDDVGIATDRDLRTRLVAEGRPPETPVAEIATVPVVTIDAGATVFEGLVQMISRGLHHLPVAEGDRLVGMLSSGDLAQLSSRSPLGVRVALDRATSVAGVADAVVLLPRTVTAMLDGGTRAEAVARVVSTMTDRVQRRVLDLAFAEHGDPPGEFGWLAFGSQARREQALHTDQDTGLLLPDGLDVEHRRWWARVAAWVVDALETVGYPRCTGGVMASEDLWRHDVSGWRRRVEGLIGRPTEEHLLASAILFDLRTVVGDLHAGRLLGPTIATAASHQTFLARLARTAVSHRPPLGFLGRLAVERSGEHRGQFDVKAGAMLPIADLARLTALARGGAETATRDRLDAAAADHVFSADLAATLAAGYELATGLRLRHQAELLVADQEPDNWVDATALAPLERSQLRETFKAVRTAQEVVAGRYRTTMLG